MEKEVTSTGGLQPRGSSKERGGDKAPSERAECRQQVQTPTILNEDASVSILLIPEGRNDVPI